MPSQPYGPAASAREAAAIRSSFARVGEQGGQRGRERGRVAGRDELGAVDLREAADGAQQQRLAERQRGEQHAGLVDLAVGQDDEVGGGERARELGAGDEPQRGAHVRAVDERRVHPRHPDDPQLGVRPRLRARPRAARRGPCTGGSARRTAPPAWSWRTAARASTAREVVEDPVRDHVDLGRVEPQLVAQPRGAVLGVHDDRVHPLVEPALPGELRRLRLARQDVVGGEDARVPVAAAGARRAPAPRATGSARRRRAARARR